MAKDRKKIRWTEHYERTMEILTERGLLLVVGGDRPNPMTIGWGAVGSIWGKPLWIVLVRPSRYTYGLIEKTGDFTVNVPGRGLERACAVCGSASGRDVDKFAECGLTAGKSAGVVSAFIEQCPIHYECKAVHANDILPNRLAPEIAGAFYGSGDYHRVYFGEILGAYADAGRLGEL